MGIQEDLRELPGKLRVLREDAAALRLVVIALMLAVGLMGVAMPLDQGLQERADEVRRLRRLCRVCDDLEESLEVLDAVGDRIAVAADPVEWSKWAADLATAAGLVVLQQHPPAAQEFGELSVLRIGMRVSGSWTGLIGFLRALEGAHRLVRVDRVDIALGEDALVMDVELLGLCGGEELQTAASATPAPSQGEEG